MEFTHFTAADYEAVCAFLIALNREDRSHVNWNWARWEWMYGHPEFDLDSAGRIGLWKDEGRVVGAAIYDMYFGEAFCAALPEYAALRPGILDYAWRELRDDGGLGIAICDGSAAEIAAAKALGFAPAEQDETVLRLRLDRVPERRLPEGFRLHEPDPETELEALQWLFWQGFDHGSDRAEFEAAEQIPPRPRSHLDHRLHLTAVDPAGELAAYCGLWYWPGTDYAYVEPVCTVPAARGRGLAGALLSECLRRARDLGARQAYVISDQAFYRKLGFWEDRHFTFYWKKQRL